MAKNNSFIEMQGTLGKLTFYEREGKQLVRRKGNLTKERLMNDPKFRRTRENMNEFGGAALVAKQFRDSLGTLISQLGDSSVSSRLTGIIRKIASKGTGKRGQRSFLMQPNKRQFESFEFNKKRPFSTVFLAKYVTPAIDENRSVVTWDIPSFNLERELKMPEGTTHYQFVLATGLVSDHVFDPDVSRYEPVSPELNQRSVFAYSEPMEVAGLTTTPLSLTTDFELTEALPESVLSVSAIGVLFFQESDGDLYDLDGATALKIAMAA